MIKIYILISMKNRSKSIFNTSVLLFKQNERRLFKCWFWASISKGLSSNLGYCKLRKAFMGLWNGFPFMASQKRKEGYVLRWVFKCDLTTNVLRHFPLSFVSIRSNKEEIVEILPLMSLSRGGCCVLFIPHLGPLAASFLGGSFSPKHVIEFYFVLKSSLREYPEPQT